MHQNLRFAISLQLFYATNCHLSQNYLKFNVFFIVKFKKIDNYNLIENKLQNTFIFLYFTMAAKLNYQNFWVIMDLKKLVLLIKVC